MVYIKKCMMCVSKVAKTMYDYIADFCSLVCRKLWSAIKVLCNGIYKVFYNLFFYLFKFCKSAFLGIVKSIKFIFKGYTEILLSIARFSFKKGLFGDIVLCISTIIWIFWPLLAFFFVPYMSLKISSIIVTGIFMFTGYGKLAKEWE